MNKRNLFKNSWLVFLLLASSLKAKPISLIEAGDSWQYAIGNHSLKSSQVKWQQINLPYNFSALAEFKNYQGWVTIKRKLPEQIKQWKIQSIPLAIKTAALSDVAQLYINDILITQNGKVEPYNAGLYSSMLVDIPNDALYAQEDNFISIKLFTPGDTALRVTAGTFQIGPAFEIYQDYYLNEVLQFSLLSIYFIVGIYHLLLSLKRRKDIYNLFFGFFCVFVSFYWFMFTGTRDLLFRDNQILRTRIEYLIVFFLPSMMLFFLSYLLQRPKSKFNRTFHWISLAYTTLLLVPATMAALASYPLMQVALKMWQLSLPCVLVLILSFIIVEAFRGNLDARYLLGGTVILIFGTMFDLLIALDVIESIKISQYTFLAFILSIAAILSNRFVRVHNQAEELNITLEQKVRERTRELEQALHEVRNLKEQQDGDYFLTSLLISPLSQNSVQSKTVAVDTFSKQKKQFKFRKWLREIGGDINIAHTIELRDREYVVFINADAMGKSLQGASGALVLGAVFLSIIERTKLSPNERRKSPEHWLRDAFTEVQKVFESFDGSMLVSLVFGIVDTHSGLMYFLNAEHPFPVLYRDGKASFIDPGIIFRKLGSSIAEGQIQIQIKQLLSGDCVILGSDGRDDILIAGQDSEKVINEDETLFLRHVEEGKGNLQDIVKTIEKTGELYDDLSLMRIQFDPNYQLGIEDKPLTQEEEKLLASLRHKNLAKQEVEQEIAGYLAKENFHPRIVREIIKFYSRLANYGKAAEIVERYLKIRPDDSEYFLVASYLYYKNNQLENAIDYSERLRLRNPYHTRNLLQLSEIWFKVGNLARSRKLLGELLAMPNLQEPISRRAQQLLQRVEFTGQ